MGRRRRILVVLVDGRTEALSLPTVMVLGPMSSIADTPFG
jgi:hypothetical protein